MPWNLARRISLTLAVSSLLAWGVVSSLSSSALLVRDRWTDQSVRRIIDPTVYEIVPQAYSGPLRLAEMILPLTAATFVSLHLIILNWGRPRP